ncbi:MAG: substrate-binding domain-containing protein [Chloroflexi bacterium]|nr:substrate-binding domain-containing protein [Chloroflexota bacterium]
MSILLVLALVLSGAAGCRQETMTLATTTSTYDTGLLDALIPPFEKESGVKVKVVAVGTGQALALGAKGDADILLVHDPKAEQEFMDKGYGSLRVPVMSSFFVLVGPQADPAETTGAASAAQALARIARARSPFVSRGDNSGTQAKENELWAAASLRPPLGEPWYLSAGQGMAETLILASEKQAYTISDIGTYLVTRERLNLSILVAKDELLRNPYSIIMLDTSRNPQVQTRLAAKLKDYLLSRQTQEAIARFGVDRFGRSLFTPAMEGVE